MTYRFCALIVLLLCGLAQAADLPRYKLPVGRVLSYSSVGKSKQVGGGETTSSSNFRLIVSAENKSSTAISTC